MDKKVTGVLFMFLTAIIYNLVLISKIVMEKVLLKYRDLNQLKMEGLYI